MRKGLLLVCLILSMGLVSCAMNAGNNEEVYEFLPGWYKFDGENVKEPLYFEYDVNEKITRAGTMDDPVLESQFNIIQDTYKFSRVHNQLSSLRDADELNGLPKWVYANTSTSYKKSKDGFIDGFVLSDGITEKKDVSVTNPTFEITKEGSSVSYETFYYWKDENGNFKKLKTVSRPSLHLYCKGNDVSEYFTVTNRNGADISDYNSFDLTNDMKIICKKLPETDMEFNFTVINKDKFIDSKNSYENVFDVTITLKAVKSAN